MTSSTLHLCAQNKHDCVWILANELSVPMEMAQEAAFMACGESPDIDDNPDSWTIVHIREIGPCACSLSEACELAEMAFVHGLHVVRRAALDLGVRRCLHALALYGDDWQKELGASDAQAYCRA